MSILRKIMRDGSVKEIHYGYSVEHTRASRNMKDYFDKQDKGEIKGGEIRVSDASTHRFNR